MEYQKILLTGATGFIAKRVALELLQAGHDVTGSVRKLDRADEVRTALVANGLDPAALDRLSFVTLDLMRDEGWDSALQGMDALVHTASPFPLGEALGEAGIITPAVEGTMRALRAAQKAGVHRVVLTSSMEAVMHKHSGELTEANWSDLDAPSCSLYTKSKILAERAAWDFVKDHPEMKLTVINPGMVVGTPMDAHYGSSMEVVKRVFGGRDPMMPDLSLPVVDLKDVAYAHAAALRHPESIGHRYMLCASFMTMPDMGRVLKDAYPKRRIATRIAPGWMIRIMAMFDGALRTVVALQGWHPSVNNTASRRDLGVDYTSSPDALLQSAAYLAAEA